LHRRHEHLRLRIAEADVELQEVGSPASVIIRPA
jgi:hypothetical protein